MLHRSENDTVIITKSKVVREFQKITRNDKIVELYNIFASRL